VYTRRVLRHALEPQCMLVLLLHGNTRYGVLVDVMQTLMCFDDWSSVSVRQEV
jgi:hypothetical protein